MKVLVVGAGASGLPALKTAIEYGFNAVCMEKSNDIGGLWRYKPNPACDEGTVMRSTVINTSKEMTAYSDFPPPSSAANYMHNREMLAYLRDYANHFNLVEHVRFRHRVLSIYRAKEFATTGQWIVTYENLDAKIEEKRKSTNEKNNTETSIEGVKREGKTSIASGSGDESDCLSTTTSGSDGHITETEMFDSVMVCTGHHSIPYYPSPFPGQTLFTGRIIHSHDYHFADASFENQNVVVVGIGNSGGDIAVELSKVACRVYLSTRSGSWIMNRVWDYGEPSDLVLLNRFTFALRSMAPRSLQNRVLEHKLNKRFDHRRFGLQPEHRFLEAHVTVNDELPNRIISGTVVVKPNILEFMRGGVVFEDGTVIENVDTVIFATGYSFAFPMIEDGTLVEVNENQVLLYKYMFPIELAPKNTLAIIGLIQPSGSIMPISEMQCRLFCAQLAGTIPPLPPQSEMLVDTLQIILKNKSRFVERRRHTLQVYYVTYMDSLAKLLNVKPNIVKFLLTDVKLAHRLIFQGLVPYQYRLEGDHRWSGAREAIFGVEQRVLESTFTRHQAKPPRPFHKSPQSLLRMLV